MALWKDMIVLWLQRLNSTMLARSRPFADTPSAPAISMQDPSKLLLR